MLYLCVRVCVHVTLQSCDGSEYTLQGPAGGDDITGLSAEPAHYQLLSELGENVTVRPRVEIAPICLHKSFKATACAVRFHLQSTLCIAGRGFNNLSQVNMARYIPTGQLVAVKQTNLDECTEEELLQLMVSRDGNVFKGHVMLMFGFILLFWLSQKKTFTCFNVQYSYCPLLQHHVFHPLIEWSLLVPVSWHHPTCSASAQPVVLQPLLCVCGGVAEGSECMCTVSQ